MKRTKLIQSLLSLGLIGTTMWSCELAEDVQDDLDDDKKIVAGADIQLDADSIEIILDVPPLEDQLAESKDQFAVNYKAIKPTASEEEINTAWDAVLLEKTDSINEALVNIDTAVWDFNIEVKSSGEVDSLVINKMLYRATFDTVPGYPSAPTEITIDFYYSQRQLTLGDEGTLTDDDKLGTFTVNTTSKDTSFTEIDINPAIIAKMEVDIASGLAFHVPVKVALDGSLYSGVVELKFDVSAFVFQNL